MASHRNDDNKRSTPEARVRKFERRVVEEIELTDTQSARTAAKREWLAELRFALAWVGLWLLLAATALFARGAWPPDETRLLGIAWEMWSQRQFAVPHLNGEPQLHAPLFFWLIHLGWLAFGVSEWWARLVAPLGALASLIVTQRLARLLWPQETEVARYAPLLLLGMFSLDFVATLTLPETWTLCLVLLALWALAIQWRRRDMRGWLLVGAALGLAMLNTGLIACVYILPLAAMAPLWARAPRPRWKYWYADLFKSALLAGVFAGSWLALAGAKAGAPYVARFLSHAWEGMPLELFARIQPWWWYALWAPVVFLPWSVLPLAWMRLWHIRREPLEDGFVFCLAWAVLPLLLLSGLPVKQPQFLLPLAPAGALLAARLLQGRALRGVLGDQPLAGMALPLLALGGVLMALPKLPRVEFLPSLLWEQSPLLGLAVMGIGIASAWLPMREVPRRIFDIAAAAVLLTVFALFGLATQFSEFFPMAEVGQALNTAQARGQPLAYVGDYRGEFQFAGRLREPLALIDPARVEIWAQAHADGVIVVDGGIWHPRRAAQPLFDAPFRDRRLRVFESRQVLSETASSGS